MTVSAVSRLRTADTVRTTPPAPTLAEIKGWPAAVDVTAACRALGISRSTGYDLIQRDEFPARVITVGGRHRVLTASLVRLLDPDPAA